MSRISDAFQKGKAFIPFITCGDPDLETTKKAVVAMDRAGADVIELGIPFSDPTAEGPVIQAANLRALSGHVTTDKVLEMAEQISGSVSAPLVFMTYANVVYSYGNTRETGAEGGTEKFLAKAARAGIAGLILPDVPFEEREDFAPLCRKYGIDLITLIAPTSEQRVLRVAKEAEGFVYCVSSLGVTGVRSKITTDIGAMVELVRQATDVPAAVGFGISTPEQAREMASRADGVIVGSAIVKLIARYGRDCVPYVEDYVRSMKAAITD